MKIIRGRGHECISIGKYQENLYPSNIFWRWVCRIGLGTGLYYYYAYWRETPRFALWQMVRAIQANDTQTLFQYIDIPSIADQLVTNSAGDVDTWLLNKGFGGTSEEDDVSRLARSLTKKFARFITPKVIAALEPQLKRASKNISQN